MNELRAKQEGFFYAGPTIRPYPRQEEQENWNKDVLLAKEIKKTYKNADYRIVTGTATSWLGQGNKGIYGNEVFNKLYHLIAYGSNFDQRKAVLAAYRQQATDDFNKRMMELDNLERDILADEQYLKDMRKN